MGQVKPFQSGAYDRSGICGACPLPCRRGMSKIKRLTPAPKPESQRPLCARCAAIMIAGTVSYWTTGTSAYVHSLFLIPCSVNGFVLPYCPQIRSCTSSFTMRRICAVVAYAVRLLLPAPTGLFIAQTARSVSPADRPPSA
jgi:hypothetical protein